jgi:hypothetical protein
MQTPLEVAPPGSIVGAGIAVPALDIASLGTTALSLLALVIAEAVRAYITTKVKANSECLSQQESEETDKNEV